MVVKCLGCGNREFEFSVADIEFNSGVLTFICPECNEYTAIQPRVGGGIIVAIDKHAKGEVDKS